MSHSLENVAELWFRSKKSGSGAYILSLYAILPLGGEKRRGEKGFNLWFSNVQ